MEYQDVTGELDEQTQTQRLNSAQALVTYAIAALPEEDQDLEEPLQEIQGRLLDRLTARNAEARLGGTMVYEDAPKPEDIFQGNE